jgi:hypothetical protein
MAIPYVSHSFSRAYIYVDTLNGKVTLIGGGAVMEASSALLYVSAAESLDQQHLHRIGLPHVR